jgi:SAM-dependent methyltransferase
MTSPGKASESADEIRRAYAEYDADPERQRSWRPTDPLELFYRLGRLSAIGRLLRDADTQLDDVEILDVGCGYGRSLVDLLVLGADTGRLHGIDVLPDRVDRLRRFFPTADVRVGDARDLPWPSGTFHLITQFTALSSIPTTEDRRLVIAEIRRVLRPGGLFLSWDLIARFGESPTGLSRRTLADLCAVPVTNARATGLDPRLAGRLIRIAPYLARVLEATGRFPSHMAALVRFDAVGGSR